MKKTRKYLPTGFDPHDPVNMQEFKNQLDSKGPGFCLAKWTQVTTHLGSGITHSCHHVGAHKIKIDEIENDPGALHNTEFKKERRQEMLNGQRPIECDYCWRIEDNSDHFSDRVTKSISSWSYPYLNDIINSNGTENIYPKYVEVSFSNVCNFKCAYCGPAFSSKWTEEVKEKAAYKFTEYYNTYGSWDLVAVAWYAGPGTANKAKALGLDSVGNIENLESFGPNVSEYVNSVMDKYEKVLETASNDTVDSYVSQTSTQTVTPNIQTQSDGMTPEQNKFEKYAADMLRALVPDTSSDFVSQVPKQAGSMEAAKIKTDISRKEMNAE